MAETRMTIYLTVHIGKMHHEGFSWNSEYNNYLPQNRNNIVWTDMAEILFIAMRFVWHLVKFVFWACSTTQGQLKVIICVKF